MPIASSVRIRRPAGWFVAGLGLYAGVFVTWVAFGWGGEKLSLPIGDLAFLPVSISAAVFAFRAARSGSEPRTRRAWMFVAAAFACLAVGDILWSWTELVRHQAPFPSWADPFYVVYYPLVLAGVLALPVMRARRGEGLTFALDATTVLLGGGMLVWYFVLRPTVIAHESGALATSLSLAYPVGDLVLIFGIATALLRRPSRASRAPLSVLVGGLVLFVVADTGYGAMAIKGTYTSGDWPDAIWMLAQFMLVVAGYLQSVAKPEAVAEDVEDERPFSMLPYVAIALGYGLLLLVARPQSDTPLGGLVIGAVAITIIVLARQVRVLHENARLLRELQMLARTDELTALLTRRSFLEHGDREWLRAQRYGRPLCAIAIDVDRFKQVNDEHGHATGDLVLSHVADQCRTTLRETDVVGRLGGDEFVALLPDTSLSAAAAIVERLRAATSAPVTTNRGTVHVTISAGIASSEDCASLSSLLERADGALYRAKTDGRDCVRVIGAAS